MIDANQLRNSTNFTADGEIYKVLKYHHNKTARGGATIKVQVRNLRTGTTREMTFNSGERVEDIRIETTQVEYLYEDGEFLVFMDIDTYEQPQMRKELFGDEFMYLKPNTNLKLMSYGTEIIDYELPPNVDHKVVESELAVAGNTATGATKRVITETGLAVQTPLFVEEGDTIRVDTRDGSYVTRV